MICAFAKPCLAEFVAVASRMSGFAAVGDELCPIGWYIGAYVGHSHRVEDYQP